MTTTFVLIPGAGGQAWYWHRLAAELDRRGHRAVAVDLPTDDDTAGLAAYADAVGRGDRGPLPRRAGRPVDGRAHRATAVRPARGRTPGAGERDDPAAPGRPAASGGPSPGRARRRPRTGRSRACPGNRTRPPSSSTTSPPTWSRRAAAATVRPVRPAVRGPVAARPGGPTSPPGSSPAGTTGCSRPTFQRRVAAERLGIARRRDPRRPPGGAEPARSSWPTGWRPTPLEVDDAAVEVDAPVRRCAVVDVVPAHLPDPLDLEVQRLAREQGRGEHVHPAGGERVARPTVQRTPAPEPRPGMLDGGQDDQEERPGRAE